MKDQEKTREQLVSENEELRRRVSALEASETEWRRTEEALQRSDERFRLLVEAIPQPIWRSDADGNVIEFNRRWHEYTGQTAEEAKGSGWTKALHSDEAAMVVKKVRAGITSGAAIEIVNRLRRASDGSYRWHLARAVPMNDRGGKIIGWFGSCTDIDDQKRAEEALQKAHVELEQKVKDRTAELSASNEQLRIFQRFAEASGQGFSMADLSGHLLYMNPALCRMLGEDKPQDRIGQHISIYYPEEVNHSRETERFPALMRDGYWQGELPMRSRQGELIPTWHNTFLIRDESGKPFRIAVVITDITERKQAEEVLAESEAKYRTLVETSPDAVIMLDLQGHITLASQRAVELYGAERVDELLGRNPLEFFALEDQQKFLAELRRTLDKGVTRDVEYTFLRKDGSRLPGEASAAVIRDASGKPTALVAIIRDITERKLAEAALERERQSLWQMLQASDHERQTISYEIHDGLTQYLAAAGMQLQVFDGLRESNPEEAKKAYDAATQLISQSHSEARRLISEVRPPVIDEIGIETAISHLVHEHRRHGGPEIECRSSVQFGRLPPILENAIYRIAQEALTNACKHSKSKKVTVTMTQEGQDVRLEVRDWGSGFDPESVEKGHFGLEGIRQRVRLLGGRLTIESTPGSGTLVHVVVPILEKRTEE